jgi:hypothetical protein
VKSQPKPAPTLPTGSVVAQVSRPGQPPVALPLHVTYVSSGVLGGPQAGTTVAPGLLAAGGQSAVSFITPLPGRGLPPGALTRFVGPESIGEFFDVSRLRVTRELAPRLASEPWTPEIEGLWAKEGISHQELISLSTRLKARGFAALQAENDPILRVVVRAHAERGLVRGSPLVSLAELTPEQALGGGLPPVATQRAYVVRVLVDPEDVGKVNEILGRTGKSKLAQEMEVVVAQDLAGEARIISITPNPAGPLGSGLGTAIRWGGKGLAVLGAATAGYEVVTAEGPHRREIEGRAFGSFAGGTILGALGVGFCIGAGIATGGVVLLLCGLVAGGVGALGGQALGGSVGKQFD